MPKHERLSIWLPGYTREEAKALADALARVAARGNRREFLEAIVGGEVVVAPLDPGVAQATELYLRWASSVVEDVRVSEGLEVLADAIRDAQRRYAEAQAADLEEYEVMEPAPRAACVMEPLLCG